MNVPIHPTLNAGLNALSGIFLVAGYANIRRRRIRHHRAFMLAAFGTSILFLISYLVYHSRAGTVPFTGQGWVRPFYYAVLASHTVLAAAIVPMAVLTIRRALAGQWERHRRLARWTLPLWLYVSVTGAAVIYVLLYLLYPAPRSGG